MSDWITQLGYLGAFLGAFVEGEILLLTAVQTARMGLLDLYGVLGCFFAGTLAADWTFFLIGRYRGRAYIASSRKLGRQFIRMKQLFVRKGGILLFAYRFMYGFRIILPVLFGVYKVRFLHFAICSLISTSIWVGVFGYLGYHFSTWLQQQMQQWSAYSWIFWLVLLLGAVLVFLRWRQRQRRRT